MFLKQSARFLGQRVHTPGPTPAQDRDRICTSRNDLSCVPASGLPAHTYLQDTVEEVTVTSVPGSPLSRRDRGLPGTSALRLSSWPSQVQGSADSLHGQSSVLVRKQCPPHDRWGCLRRAGLQREGWGSCGSRQALTPHPGLSVNLRLPCHAHQCRQLAGSPQCPALTHTDARVLASPQRV